MLGQADLIFIYILHKTTEHIQRLLTDTNSDKERDVCDHLPQHVPEVPFTAAVAVLHQLGSPQNCTEEVLSFVCDKMGNYLHYSVPQMLTMYDVNNNELLKELSKVFSAY